MLQTSDFERSDQNCHYNVYVWQNLGFYSLKTAGLVEFWTIHVLKDCKSSEMYGKFTDSNFTKLSQYMYSNIPNWTESVRVEIGFFSQAILK